MGVGRWGWHRGGGGVLVGHYILADCGLNNLFSRLGDMYGSVFAQKVRKPGFLEEPTKNEIKINLI